MHADQQQYHRVMVLFKAMVVIVHKQEPLLQEMPVVIHQQYQER
jgi:hypothetical protein